MSTRPAKSPTLESALASVPVTLRSRLVKYHTLLKQAFVRGDYDACGARAGKFCETLVRLIQHNLEGTYTPFGQQLNLYTEARRLEQLPTASGPEQFRVFIPRAVSFLYTLRNKRGFAHVGGDLDSERFDAVTCVRVADWCLCELIRVVHGLSVEEAQGLVDALAVREAPEVWSVAGRKRVMRKGLTFKQQVLLLLYGEPADAVLIEDLFEWTEYSRMDLFKTRVLAPLHSDRLVEWDRATDAVFLSPSGIAEVEQAILQLEPAS